MFKQIYISRRFLINAWTPDGRQMVIDGNGKYLYHDYEGTKITRHAEEYKNGKRKK